MLQDTCMSQPSHLEIACIAAKSTPTRSSATSDRQRRRHLLFHVLYELANEDPYQRLQLSLLGPGLDVCPISAYHRAD